MRRNGPTRIEALRAAATLVATVASFCTVYLLCRQFGASAQPAIVAAILAIGLFRRPALPGGAAALLIPVVLAAVGLAASGVGLLLRTLPILGAAVFVAGMFLSIWLYNFGDRARRAGGLIALPLVAMLIVPPPDPHAPGGPFVDLALIVVAGPIALAYSAALAWLARTLGLPAAGAERADAGTTAPRAPRPGMTVQTRMALQMAVALSLAFAAGFALFPAHWGWAVLTAFIVCAGARGRGDAAYKGVLRLAGALGGTLAAAALGRLWAPSGVAEAIAIFAALYFGLWLRAVSYAYWAAAMTLVLALLAGAQPGSSLGLLGIRLEAIFAGALCAVAAAWFVFPIRTRDVVRRRLADALVALDEFVVHAAGEERTAKFASFEHRLGELDRVAPPLRWHRRIARDDSEHPARWIELAGQLRGPAEALGASSPEPEVRRARIRKAIGASRRALANHGKPEAAAEGGSIGAALTRLRNALDDSL